MKARKTKLVVPVTDPDWTLQKYQCYVFTLYKINASYLHPQFELLISWADHILAAAPYLFLKEQQLNSAYHLFTYFIPLK